MLEKRKKKKESLTRLIFQIHNSWNHRLKLNQATQFPTNLILNDEIIKKISIKKSQGKSMVIKMMIIKSNRKKTKRWWNCKKKKEVIQTKQ